MTVFEYWIISATAQIYTNVDTPPEQGKFKPRNSAMLMFIKKYMERPFGGLGCKG